MATLLRPPVPRQLLPWRQRQAQRDAGVGVAVNAGVGVAVHGDADVGVDVAKKGPLLHLRRLLLLHHRNDLGKAILEKVGKEEDWKTRSSNFTIASDSRPRAWQGRQRKRKQLMWKK